MYKMHRAAAVHMYVGEFSSLFSSVSNSYHVVYFVARSLDLNTHNKLKASKHKTRRCFGTTPARHYEHALDNDI